MYNTNPSSSRYRHSTSYWFILLLIVIAGYAFIPKPKGSDQNFISVKTPRSMQKQSLLAADLSSDSLFVLSLENTGGTPQLYNLLKERKHKRLVFHFYKEAGSGKLGLYAFPGKRVQGIRTNRGKFDTTAVQKLAVSTLFGKLAKNEELILGSLQLDENAVKELRRHMVVPNGQNKKGFEFIWFIPTLRKDDITGSHYVYYKIKNFSQKPSDGIVVELDKLDILAEANPSPPRKAR